MRDVDNVSSAADFAEWRQFLGNCTALEVMQFFADAIENTFPRLGSINYLAASADRLFEIASLEIGLTKQERDAAGKAAEHVVAFTRALFKEQHAVLQRFDDAIAMARTYYGTFGTETSRRMIADRRSRNLEL